MNNTLTQREGDKLLKVLQTRFGKNLIRHQSIEWDKVSKRLKSNPKKLWSLNQMEITGGEPDVVDYDEESDAYIFIDCSLESPKGRRSFCYDKEGHLASTRKPQNNVVDVAAKMGVEILTHHEYRIYTEVYKFDTKTSSWLKTPDNVRKLGGAIFGDYRYGEVFIYHNSAQAYYISRGFRGLLRI